MSDKIIKISIDTEFIGDNDLESIEDLTSNASKRIDILSDSLERGAKSAANYYKHLQSVQVLLELLKKTKQVLPPEQEFIVDKAIKKDPKKDSETEIEAEKRRNKEVEEEKAKTQKKQEAAQNKANKVAALARIKQIKEEIKEQDDKSKRFSKHQKLLDAAKEKHAKDLQEAYRLNEKFDEDLAKKKKAEAEKTAKAEVDSVTKAQQKIRQIRQAHYKVSRETIFSIKRAVDQEILEAERGRSSIIAIKKRAINEKKDLEINLQKSLRNIEQRLSGDGREEARKAALRSFALQYRKIDEEAASKIKRRTQLEEKYNSVRKKGVKVASEMEDKEKNLKKLTEATNLAAEKLNETNKSLLSRIVGVVAGYRAANFLLNKIEGTIAGIPLDGISEQANEAALVGTFGSTQASKELEIASELAQRYGGDIRALEESMKSFAPSALLAGASIQEVNQIFDDFIATGTVLHKTKDGIDSIFIALEQIFAKGTVQSEEIKRQLGNQLPAAVEIGAEAMEMSTSDFLEAMKNNEVAAKEFVPKFAKLYRTIFAGEGEVVLKSLSDKVLANYQRVVTSYTNLNRAIFGEVESIGNVALKKIASGIDFATENLEGFITVLRVLSSVLVTRVVTALSSYTKAIVVNSIASQEATRKRLAETLLLIKATRALTTAETQQLAAATVSRSGAASFLGAVTGKLKNLSVLLTGLPPQVLGVVAAFSTLTAAGLAVSRATLAYGKETAIDNNSKLGKSISVLAKDYVSVASTVQASIKNITSGGVTDASIKATGKEVRKLEGLKETYQQIIENTGLLKSESKELVEELTKVAEKYQKAREAAKSPAEVSKVDQEFTRQIDLITRQSSAINQLAKEYVAAQKQADNLAGRVNDTEHYKKLERAATFAFKRVQKEVAESNKFMVTYGNTTTTLSSVLSTLGGDTLELLGDIKDGLFGLLSGMVSFSKEIVSEAGNIASQGIDLLLKINTKIVAGLGYIKGAVKGVLKDDLQPKNETFTGWETLDSVLNRVSASFSNASKEGKKAFKETEDTAQDAIETIGNPIEKMFQIQKDLYDASFGEILKNLVEDGAKKRQKELDNLFEQYKDGFVDPFESAVRSDKVEDALTIAFKSIADLTKAELEKLKNLYDQDLIDIESYYERRGELLERQVSSEISLATRQRENARRLATSTPGAEASLKVQKLTEKLINLEEKRRAILVKNEGERKRDIIAFTDLVDKQRIAYLNLTGQLVEAEKSRQKLRNVPRLKATQEAESENQELSKQGELLLEIISAKESQRLQEARLEEQYKLTSNANERLRNQITVTNATEQAGTQSYLSSMIDRTKANLEFVEQQRLILASMEAMYDKEADKNGDQRRRIEQTRADLKAFEQSANELGTSIQTNLTGNLSTAFSDFITGSKSASEAMRDFSLSVIDSMAAIAADQLANQIISGIFDLAPNSVPNVDGVSGASVSITPHSKGGIPDIGNKQQYFPMGSLRENGKMEAILPVYRTKSGDLGVRTSGEGGSSNVLNVEGITINVATPQGTSAEDTGKLVSKAVTTELTRLMNNQISVAKRPGGLLSEENQGVF